MASAHRMKIKNYTANGWSILNLMPQAESTLSPRSRAESGTSGDSWNFSESDTYFQSAATNPWYNAVYDRVEEAMKAFGDATGRHYQRHLNNIMAIPKGTRHHYDGLRPRHLRRGVVDEPLIRGEKVMPSKVRLFRPSAKHLPGRHYRKPCSRIAADRTKEPSRAGRAALSGRDDRTGEF